MTLHALEVLREQDTVDVQGTHHLPDEEDGADAPAPEAVVLLLAGGGSVVLTTATDWTLEAAEGTWPRLPAWCHPPEQWRYGRLPGLPEAEPLGRCRDITGVRDEQGEVTGVSLTFDRHVVEVTAGEPLRVAVLARSGEVWEP